MPNITDEENERMLARLRVTLEAQGDGKCYFPCNQCKDSNRRRLVRKTIEVHCWRYGNVEGGYIYCPMVIYSLYVFVLISFIKKFFLF
jgi:hypothetical protein